MKKYETREGQLDLLAQEFGDQIGLPAQSLAADVNGRLEWYKKRIASNYERAVKRDMNVYKVNSPVEQIFLMEWRYLGVDEHHGVEIRPQNSVTIAGTTYTIDFVVSAPAKNLTIAIEIDGHEFHERTKEQAAYDRARERKITREGYTILRFSGSEIFRNPRKCVQEIVGHLEK